MKFSIWTHPETGQTRVYVSNLAGQGSAKVWIEQQQADSFGDELNVRVTGQFLNRSEKDNLKNDVERVLTERAGRRVKAWADLLALVSK